MRFGGIKISTFWIFFPLLMTMTVIQQVLGQAETPAGTATTAAGAEKKPITSCFRCDSDIPVCVDAKICSGDAAPHLKCHLDPTQHGIRKLNCDDKTFQDFEKDLNQTYPGFVGFQRKSMRWNGGEERLYNTGETKCVTRIIRIVQTNSTSVDRSRSLNKFIYRGCFTNNKWWLYTKIKHTFETDTEEKSCVTVDSPEYIDTICICDLHNDCNIETEGASALAAGIVWISIILAGTRILTPFFKSQ